MEDMGTFTRGEALAQQSAEERLAFRAFRETFMNRVPPPVKPDTLNLSGLGFEFWLYFGMAIASILLAAMRTSDAFYFVGYATSNQVWYAGVEAILSVLVVELGMVVFAAILAQKRYKRFEDERRMTALELGERFRSTKSVDVNSGVIAIGLLLMALISMAAGLHQSIRIIENVNQDFVRILSYGLGITIGIGITIIAVIAGDILGQQLAIITAGYQDRIADYDDEVAEYQKSVEDAWSRSDERRIIRAEVRGAAKQVGSSQQSSDVFGYGSVTNNFRTNGSDLRRPPKQTERVFQYMDAVYEKEQRVPAFTEVMDALGTAKATTSEARSKWLSERGLAEEQE